MPLTDTADPAHGPLPDAPVLQKAIPYRPPARLPGMAPLDPAEWILVDDAFAGQMALRAHLMATRRDAVLRLADSARPAATELLGVVLDQLAAHPGYRMAPEGVIRPDGVTIRPDAEDPLGTLGRLVQQDLIVMQKPEGADEHVFTGGVLCFPAQWTLAEKFGHPLIRIHDPVPAYDDGIARRVQRLFDGVQPGRPLWRFNWQNTDSPRLFDPVSEAVPRDRRHPHAGQYIRSERQVLWRLPQTRAVIFGVHTFLVRAEDVAAG